VTPDQFITKWKATELKERSAAQSHFIDLCRLLDEPAPTDADSTGEWYAFERGATKTTGGEGWADVWKRDHFGWEYKGKRKDLKAAFAQLQQYALALENPPLDQHNTTDRFPLLSRPRARAEPLGCDWISRSTLTFFGLSRPARHGRDVIRPRAWISSE
jgi:hypothetical protein